MIHKYKSRRFLFALWAVGLATTLAIWAMAAKYAPDWLSAMLALLVGIVGVYIPAESYTKTRIKPEGKDQ